MFKILSFGTVLLVGLAILINLFTPWSVIPRHDPDEYVLQALAAYRENPYQLSEERILSKTYSERGWDYRVEFTSAKPEIKQLPLFQDSERVEDGHAGLYRYEAELVLEPHRLLDWQVVRDSKIAESK